MTQRSIVPPPQVKISLLAHWTRGTGAGVLLQSLGLVLAFGSSVLVARLLGPQGLGKYSYALAIVAVLSVLATLGLPTVIARLLAAYQAKGEWALARGLLRWSNLIIGGLGLLLGLLLMAGSTYVPGGQQWLYFLAAPLVVVLAWANLRQRALQALHRPLAAQLPEQLIKHSVFLTICAGIWVTGYQILLNPEGIMAVWLFAGLASLLFGVVLLHRLSPSELHEPEVRYKSGEWLAIALPMFLAEVLGVVFGNSDTILLGWFHSPKEVGLYQVALRLSSLMLILLGASNWVLAPWFSRFHTTGEKERLQRVVTRTTRAIFAATLGVYTVMILWGEAFLAMFFGSEFIRSYPMLLILGAGQLVNVASGPVVNLLAMTSGQRELAWSVAVVAVVNIILCILLIPLFGMIGAAVSTATSTAGYNLLLAIVVKRRIGISAAIWGKSAAN